MDHGNQTYTIVKVEGYKDVNVDGKEIWWHNPRSKTVSGLHDLLKEVTR